jgi:hypothetical protein
MVAMVVNYSKGQLTQKVIVNLGSRKMLNGLWSLVFGL